MVDSCKLIILIFLFSISVKAEIFVNQEGYLRNYVKYALSNKQVSSFEIFDLSHNLVYSGSFQLRAASDEASGMNLYLADFTELNEEGEYFLVSDVGDTSFTFSISDTVFKNLYKKSLKGFYYQRCGTALTPNYAGEFSHLKCHSTDAFFHATSSRAGFKYASGGWHDAGDFGKYIVNAGITVGTLLLSYEMFPEKFSQNDLNIPESGNSMPDLLDEIKYELEWFLKVQDTSGGVFTKLTAENFSGFVMPEKDNSQRYLYEFASTATGDFAAVLAKASRIYKPFDEEFSSECLTSAIKAWEFLENNSSIIPAGGFRNPDGTNTGEYGDSNDRDERLWASIELYTATGENKYLNYYSANFNSVGLFEGMSWQNVKSLAHINFLLNSAEANSLAAELLKTSLKNLCDSFVSTSDKNGFPVSLQNSQYTWGSNATVLNNALLLIYAYKIFDEQKYFDAALNQLDYVLGLNPHNISFVTGVGKKYPMHIHHRQSEADDIEEPVPGLIAGGPNQYLNDSKLQQLFTDETPPALCYVDHLDSYASNEIAINWNAPLVFVAGYFGGESTSTSVEKSDVNTPEKFLLNQNYPNPFNSTTTITFFLDKNESVGLKIYNSLGKEIFDKDFGFMSEGFHLTRWSGIDNSSKSVSSGIYFYELNTESASQTKKMILIK